MLACVDVCVGVYVHGCVCVCVCEYVCVFWCVLIIGTNLPYKQLVMTNHFLPHYNVIYINLKTYKTNTKISLQMTNSVIS